MAVGTFGGYLFFETVFDTDGIKGYTFRNLSRSVNSRSVKHELLAPSKKPKSQFMGPDLSELSLEVTFSAQYGVNPRKMLETLKKCVDQGIAAPFVVGTKKIGVYRISSMSETWETIIQGGKLMKATGTITMEEYS